MYVAFNTNNTMYRQFEDIEENERLDERNQALSIENEKRTRQNEELIRQNEQLIRQNEQLIRQNEQLTRQVTKLRQLMVPKKMKVCARCGEAERKGVKYYEMTHPNSTFDLCQNCFDTPTMELTIEELCEREQEREQEREREREKIEIDSPSQISAMNVDE